MKGLFPVRSCRRRGRTRPQGGSLNVPRPDASNPTGTRNGSHPEGRSNAADGTAVDIASMSVGLLLRVVKWMHAYLAHPNGQTCCTRLYTRPYNTIDFKMDLWPSKCGNRICGEDERIGAASIAFPGVGDDAGIRACRDRKQGQPKEVQHRWANRLRALSHPPGRRGCTRLPMIQVACSKPGTTIMQRSAAMKHYAGLDVSVKETSVCIVDENGKLCRERKAVSHPDDLVAILSDPAFSLERVGVEAGPLSQWLFEGLAKAGLPVFCIETRHTKAFLDALQQNKSDRNDARGIAQMMRVGLFKDVHVKTLTSQKRRALLTARSLLQEKAIDLENEMRGLLRNFGLKVGHASGGTFENRILELVEHDAELAEIMEPLLAGRRKLREGLAKLEKRVLAEAKQDEVCRRLMTVPGVGPIVSLAYVSTIDIPSRFRHSRSVGAILGLTPVLKQSGEVSRVGHISLRGDAMMRRLLYEAAQSMMTRVVKWCWLKAWAMNIAKRHGSKKAKVALARRLAVVMHRMWVDGSEFRWTREDNVSTVAA